jgi:hypothetical protein
VRGNRYRQYNYCCQPQLSIASASDLHLSLIVRRWKEKQRFRETEILNLSVYFTICIKYISLKKEHIYKMKKYLKTLASSKMIALFSLAITWNTTQNVRTIDPPVVQTAFRIQHRSSTAKLKHFGMCVKNKYCHFTIVYKWCTCHCVGYNNGSSYLQLFIIN